MRDKLYLFYDDIWDEHTSNIFPEFGEGTTREKLKGACLAHNEDSAKWQARIAKIEYDRIESIESLDQDSKIFKVAD